MTKQIDPKILQLTQIIEAKADQDFTLEQMASAVAISPFHLQRKFKATLGMSPKQYQNILRIKKLKQSLKQGEAISHAIYDAGFGSNSRVYEQQNTHFGMTLRQYQQGANNLAISFAISETQLGKVLMAGSDKGVCFVQFGASDAELIGALHSEFPYAALSYTRNAVNTDLDKWLLALDHYLTKQTQLPNLPLDLYGTAFQLSVWQFLVKIPKGHKASYQDVAKGIGKPKSYRAVANACGANKVAILIPCHRVLRGNGELGGYRWGTERKQHLLDLEKPTIAQEPEFRS